MSDIHSCSYFCTRPACVLAQRDEMRDKLMKQAEPVALTVVEIEQMNAQWNYEIHGDRTRYLVRMTEKAHGIGEKE